MNRGSLGVRELNLLLQRELNPPRENGAAVEKFGWQFRPATKSSKPPITTTKRSSTATSAKSAPSIRSRKK
jgi:hypothetical protein